MSGRLESFSKWLQLKIYQLEVTLSVYMFTPSEKFFFCTFVALFSPSCHTFLPVLLTQSLPLTLTRSSYSLPFSLSASPL